MWCEGLLVESLLVLNVSVSWSRMQEISIRTDTIRLGQLLKLANVVECGSEAKARIQGGEVRVNGEVETRRGRQLHAGDRVEFAATTLVITQAFGK